ncbi:MAG: sigma-70 family RNA polymerase sigma factor [Peptococcaceae bacterium]|nr:sigma-70 family RNA polymerase sigma factor [Peptococcaceae bacterium]
MEAGCPKQLPPEMIVKIFELYHKTMLAMAYEFLKDTHKAEDVVQEVFERLSKYKLDIYNPYSVKTRCLMKVMVRNAALTYREKDSRLPTMPFQDELYREIDYIDPERHYLEKSDYLRIMDIIEKMDPTIRDAMKLKYGLGMPTEEISQVLGVNYALTRYRIQRGRVLLRAALEKEREERKTLLEQEEQERKKRQADKAEQERQKEKIVIQFIDTDR